MHHTPFRGAEHIPKEWFFLFLTESFITLITTVFFCCWDVFILRECLYSLENKSTLLQTFIKIHIGFHNPMEKSGHKVLRMPFIF